MPKLTAITVGSLTTPSTWYRLGQFIPLLNSQGWDVDCIMENQLANRFKELEQADVILIQKCLLNGLLRKRVLSLKKPLWFDFDDAIYTRAEKPYNFITSIRVKHRLKEICKNSFVTCPNLILESWAKHHAKQLKVIPMSLDLNEWRPLPEGHHEFWIGWSGAPHNLTYIEEIEHDLSRLLKHHRHVKLAIYSGKRPNLSIPFHYEPFEHRKESEFTKKLSIGLLPLRQDLFTEGKSPIKALQYMACGVPVVGNLFGATHEMVPREGSLDVNERSSWYQTLSYLIEREPLRKKMQKYAREKAEAHHSLENNFTQILEILNTLKK